MPRAGGSRRRVRPACAAGGDADAEATDQATARELIKLAVGTVRPDQRGRGDES